MTLMELANELVAASREGRTEAFLRDHYAPDAVSVEAAAMDPTRGREAVGIEAIRAKHDWWNRAIDMLESDVEGPFPHGEDRFAVLFSGRARNKATGDTFSLREVAVYYVAGGKIVREEFSYPTN